MRLTSPKVYAIPEIRHKDDIKILDRIYRSHGCVQNGLDNGKYTIGFIREFDRDNDSNLFRQDGKGWSLVEGKNFHQFIPDYLQSEFTILSKEGLDKTKTKKDYENKTQDIHDHAIPVFRKVASSTNIRTMISCIIPPHRFFSDSCPVLTLTCNNRIILGKEYGQKILYLAADSIP